MKRHKWVYPGYCLATEDRPAKCPCGAQMYFVRRKKKSGPTDWYYGHDTEDEVIVTADGTKHVNPRPRPACSR